MVSLCLCGWDQDTILKVTQTEADSSPSVTAPWLGSQVSSERSSASGSVSLSLQLHENRQWTGHLVKHCLGMLGKDAAGMHMHGK